ncbi:DUF5808 domain-containing protein [Vagococcus vulneris]|uniref:DUF5808 domain-containing protein n=1 Tax=Vagococcus vulneris TaxID=1977869 RepID=A0A430A259_9ENTE|nr:DUF5808 domain-containing protein [Vagococcus vulneris]RSU00528.1 hypothetical protein CBF37_00500 [Vagococcus vulneris]
MVIGMIIITLLIFNMSLAATPLINRRSNSFGVTIPSGLQQNNYVNRMNQNFVKRILLTNIPVFLPLLLIINKSLNNKRYELLVTVYLLFGISVYLLIFIMLYMSNRKALIQFIGSKTKVKTTSDVVVDLNFRKKIVVFPNWLFILINSLLIVFGIIYTLINYDEIPAQIPMRFDVRMEPVIFMSKTWLHLMMIPFIQIFLMLVSVITNRALIKSKQQLSLNQTKTYQKNDVAFRKINSISLFVTVVLLQLLFLFIQIATITPNFNYTVLLVVIALVLISIVAVNLYVGIKYRQSGDGLTPDVNFDVTNDDEYWKGGIFYYNPQDPSVWLEKKVGTGLTLNMAKWQAWALLFATIILPIAMMILLK